MTPQVKKPPTFDAQFVLRDASRGRRLVRDLKVLRFLAMVLLFWATKGRRIRRSYRAALASGRPFVLEEEVLPLLQGARPQGGKR